MFWSAFVYARLARFLRFSANSSAVSLRRLVRVRNSLRCASSRSGGSYLRERCATSCPIDIPISMFAAGPVREDTRRTTLSPNVQHWWRAMASNWIMHGRNCADTVP